MPKFVFILCPPFSGSTVLWQLLQTSPYISALPSEGQYLDPVRPLMSSDRWDANHQFPWEQIKQEWSKFWDFDKPLLLEKSPPNLLRASDIERVFSPAYFIVMMREPYALCEGLARRRNRRHRMFRHFQHTPPHASNSRDYAMKFAANLWAKFATWQIMNVQQLERVVFFTYEGLTGDTPAVVERILRFLPELGHLDVEQKFRLHSVTGTDNRRLTNMNDTKWQCLLRREIQAINSVLAQHQDCMDFFGYRIREPDRFQDLRAVAMRSKSLILKLKNEGREAVVGSLLGRRYPTSGVSRWRWLLRMAGAGH